MPINLMKLAVGSTGIDSIERYQSTRIVDFNGQKATWITTRNRPKKEEELLDGGSLYWILKSKFLARQRVLGLETDTDEEGRKFCRFILEPKLHPTAPKPYRPFQGWRYLKHDDIPADLEGDSGVVSGLSEMPQEMIEDLQKMGLV